MVEKAELIVEFVRGCPEDEARKLIEHHGGSIRRRMRSDHADLVTFLIKCDAEKAPTVDAALRSSSRVLRTEANQGGFRAL